MMKAWKNYRCWWDAYSARNDWVGGETFEKHINEMSLHKLMQTLEDWEDNS